MKYRFIQLFLILLVPAILPAQIDRSSAPKAGPAPEIKIGEYYSFELKNGLRVFVVENHKIPRVAYSLVVDMDPFTEGDSIGYASIAGNLLGTATSSRTKDQIDEEVDFIGASLNASSGSMFGSALKKHNEKLLDLMSDILLNPVFNQDELDKIKKQTISGLAFSKTDPSSISGVVSNVLLFGKTHPYGEVTTEKSVESVTLEMCEDFYRSYFKPNIAYLAIVGDINLKEAKKLTKKYFGDWKPGDVPEHRYETPVSPQETKIAIVDRPHAVQSVINITHPAMYTVGMEDYVPARVMNLMLGGTFARLDQNLREDHAYTYGVRSSLNQDKWIGNFSVTTDVRNEVTDSAVYQILYEMKRIQNEIAPAEEVEKIKNYMSGNFALSLEQPNTVARFALNIVRYDLPIDYYANYLKYIAEVSPEDVQAAAQKYLRPENCHVLVVGRAEDVVDKLAQFSPSEKVDYYDIEANLVDPADLVRALPAGLTAEEVIDKSLEATGGRSKLESITDLSTKMTMEVQGMKINAEMIRKSPDKFIISMKMGDMLLNKTLYDGVAGKISGMQGEKVLEGKELENLKIQAHFMPELDYAGNGYSIKLLSLEKVDEIDAYKIEITDPSGEIAYAYYNNLTGLKIKEEKTEESPEGPMVQVTRFRDYREVAGILYPHGMTIVAGPQTIAVTVESAGINIGVEDSVFK